MREISWSSDAVDDFDAAIDYIRSENGTMAIIVAERIDDAIQLLARRPIGRPGREPGTYEKSVKQTSHIIIYSLTENHVNIARIIHAAQDHP